MKKGIILIGGGGYLGTVLSSHLLKNGYKVTVLDNFIYNNQFAVESYLGDPDYRLFKGDMCNIEDLQEASIGATDVVILAGLVGDPISKKYPESSSVINDIGIKRCIDFFNGRGINKLIFISTCSNYGSINENELADEDFELNPLSLYAKAKVDNEKYILSKKGHVDYTGVILRFATAFGLSPRMRFDLTVNEFTRDIYFGKELLVYDEHTWRPYCHLRDLSRLIDIVLRADKKLVDFDVFNVGGEMNNYTKKMIVDEILTHKPEARVAYGKNGNDPRDYRISFAKVKEKLGFEPLFTVKDGVKELINAFDMGLYSDANIETEKYGNYSIKNY